MSIYKNDTLTQVKEATESILNQTFQDFDFYIQLDGPVQNGVIKYLESKEIFYIGRREINKGLSYSLNELIDIIIKNSKYKYLLRMDADDISLSNRFEKQFKFMEKNPNIDICGGFIEEFGYSKQLIKYPQKHKDIKNFTATRCPVAHVTVIMTIKAFKDAGPYDETKINEDYDLWIRFLEKNKKFYNMQETLVLVRTSDDFFERRAGYKRAREIFLLRIKATRILNFGIKGYIFALGTFSLYMLPILIKKYMYKNLRK
jgi:glycosyltransferase involved in cell wall biosynthesis